MNRVIKHNIESIVDKLSEQGVSIRAEDVHWSLMNIEEWIYIEGKHLHLCKMADDTQFGIFVDPSRNLLATDISYLSKRDRKRAQLLLDVFIYAYRQMVRDIYDELVIKA